MTWLLLLAMWQAPYGPDSLSILLFDDDCRLGTVASCDTGGSPFCLDTEGNQCIAIMNSDGATKSPSYCFRWRDWILGWATPFGPNN